MTQYENFANQVVNFGMVRFIPSHRILIDTCALMDPIGRAWVELVLWPELKRSARRLVVPKQVYTELISLSFDPAQAESATMGKILVDEMRSGGCADILGDSGDSFTEATIADIVTRCRTKYDMLVLTQNRNLAQRLTQINDSDAITSHHDLTVARIGNTGLEAWAAPQNTFMKTTASRSGQPAAPMGSQQSPRNTPEPSVGFPPPSGKISSSKGVVAVSSIPGTGDGVWMDAGNAVTLGEELASGGEGTVYRKRRPTPTYPASAFHARDAASDFDGRLLWESLWRSELSQLCRGRF